MGTGPNVVRGTDPSEWGTGPKESSEKCAKSDLSRDSDDLVDPHPFLTEFGEAGWVEKMLAIQAVALVRRMEAAHAKKLVIGVSGGADSALALLAAARAVARRKVGSAQGGVCPHMS